MVSTLDSVTLSQQTQVFRTTFAIARLTVGDVVNFRIGAVTRDGPLVEVMSRGPLVLSGIPFATPEGFARQDSNLQPADQEFSRVSP